MKIKITIKQFKDVLNFVNPKYPITIIMKNIDLKEREELMKILKKKKTN
jgi:hypothetical protein